MVDDLTERAVAEILKGMDDFKESVGLPVERKINPVKRKQPNTRFLGRTINSVMMHNKREKDRTHFRCQDKLKELDKRKNTTVDPNEEKQRSNSPKIRIKKRKKLKRLKKKKTKKKSKKHRKKSSRSSSTSSSSSSSESSCSSSTTTETSSDSESITSHKRKKRKKLKKHKKSKKLKKDKHEENYQNIEFNEYPLEFSIDPYAAMAYNEQIQHFIYQQGLIQQENLLKQELKTEISEDNLLKEELKDDDDATISDLCNLSSPPSNKSSINISLNPSSASEDENGIITFKLSSDDEKTKKFKKCDSINVDDDDDADEVDSDDDDDSSKSHISLTSNNSLSNKQNEVLILSSSSASSDCEEVIVENVVNMETPVLEIPVVNLLDNEDIDNSNK